MNAECGTNDSANNLPTTPTKCDVSSIGGNPQLSANGGCQSSGGGGGSTCTPPSSGGTKLVTDGGDPNAGQPCSPIILDLNGKGFVLTDAAHGVIFDISGTGKPIQLAWIAAGADNAFLALPGADGLVHNGKQLFGNFTPQPASDHRGVRRAAAV